MLRGYRHIVFALVGWLALAGASPPSPSGNVEQRGASDRIANSLENIVATNNKQAERAGDAPERKPCNAGDDQRDSELCAQWKAADAADRSALFGGISIIGIVVAIAFTIQSNRIARNTAKRQLRAYLGWDKFELVAHEREDGGLIDCTLSALWINAGQTPPTKLSDNMGWATFIGEMEGDFDFREGDGVGACGNLSVGPGRGFLSTSSHKLRAEQFWAVADKELRVVMWSAVDYLDAFADWRRTEVAAELVIDRLQNGKAAISFNAIPGHNGMDEGCLRQPYVKQGQRS